MNRRKSIYLSRSIHVVALVALWLAMLPAAHAAPRGFEIADYYRTAMVGSPILSPDGNRVVFSVQRYELEKAEDWSELWMMAADGSALRRLTHGKGSPSSPAFTQDGKQILFSDDRGDGSQFWLMPIDGGEARQLTDFPIELSDALYSPDGKWIAATASVFPECGADGECTKEMEETWRDGKLNAHMADTLLYRHWTSWADGRRSHILLIDASDGKVVRDLTPGDFESPIFMLGGGRGYAWSPDSKELAFVSNRDKDQATSTNGDVWIVPLAGGDPKNITQGNKGWDGSPLYSPDGKYIAMTSQETPGYEAAQFRLALFERKSGETRYIVDASNFEDWVDEMAWKPDSSSLVFQASVKGRNPLYEVSSKGGKVRSLFVDGSISHWELTPSGSEVVYSRRTIGDPTEIYRRSLNAREAPRRLTDFNRDLKAEVDIRPAEEIWVKGDGDYEVQVFIVKPHGFDPSKKYPLILNVHGGPQSQWSDSYRGDWQVYPGKGYVVAFANPTGSIGRGQDFIDAIGCDWGGRVYRDLMKVTDALEKLPYVDKGRMGSMGWSYGGYMMMWFQGHTDRFKAQAAMMGVYDLPSMWGTTEELWFVEKDMCGVPWESKEYQRWSPSNYVANFKTPTLVVTGELDYRVPYTQSLNYFSGLQRMEVPSRLVVLPDAGHWPSWYEMAFYYLVHLEWFHEHLGGGEPPYDSKSFLRNRQFK